MVYFGRTRRLAVVLVLRVLELVLLDVGPKLLNALTPGGLTLSDNVSQLLYKHFIRS